jgi:hypothetical protein
MQLCKTIGSIEYIEHCSIYTNGRQTAMNTILEDDFVETIYKYHSSNQIHSNRGSCLHT